MVLPIAKLKDPDRVDEPEIGAKGIWIFDNNWARPLRSAPSRPEVKEALAEAISDPPERESSS